MLRNCLKKGFRPVAVLTVAVLMCSLGGCSDSESGWLEGRAFTMNAYSNTGELTLNPGLLVLPKDTTFTEQVARQAGLEALSCPTVYDSKYMPGQGRYECEYVDAKGKAHDLSLLVASGDRVWLYDHNGKPMKVTTK